MVPLACVAARIRPVRVPIVSENENSPFAMGGGVEKTIGGDEPHVTLISALF